jgi:hypothetical protein
MSQLEYVEFRTPASSRSSLTDWLKGIISVLSDRLKHDIREFVEDKKQAIDDVKVCKSLDQARLVAIDIKFWERLSSISTSTSTSTATATASTTASTTATATAAITSSSTATAMAAMASDDAQQHSSHSHHRQHQLLQELIDAVQDSIARYCLTMNEFHSKYQFIAISNILCKLQHHREILRFLHDHDLSHAHSGGLSPAILMECAMRKHWEAKSSTVLIRQSSFIESDYQFCYWGFNPRIVVTPLSERVFMSLNMAFQDYTVPILKGPAGKDRRYKYGVSSPIVYHMYVYDNSSLCV